MVQPATTGRRIRARRLDLGIAQVDLAAAAGISPSYLNLIEHDRRRIAGRLLNSIARLLDLDPALLSGPDQMAQVAALVAAGQGLTAEDLAAAADLAARFPGWAALVARQARQIARQGARIAELDDRLGHDPDLAGALHAMLTAVTAIHSSATILVDSPDLDRDWQTRFHRNIHDDSARLGQTARALVRFLDAGGTAAPPPDPEDAADDWLARRGGHVPEIEAGADPAALADSAPLLARLRDYAADAARLPLAGFSAAAARAAWDPLAITAETGAPFAMVLRRLASLPPAPGRPPMALAVADQGGAILRHKPEAGLVLPRLGACPLWPLFTAGASPGRPQRLKVRLPGPDGSAYLAHAIAEPVAEAGPPRTVTTMLAVRSDSPEGAVPLGLTCRLCPRADCAARRDPSALTAF